MDVLHWNPGGESLSRIFERFYRVDGSCTELGLSNSEQIVEAHDGNTWVQSAGRHGSFFHVVILKVKKLTHKSFLNINNILARLGSEPGICAVWLKNAGSGIVFEICIQNMMA